VKYFESEREFTRWVINEAATRGWKSAHFGNTVKIVRKRDGTTKTIADRDAAGFPDLVLARERLLCAELKLSPNKPTANQISWLEALRDAGVETHVWNEQQQAEIVRTLEARISPKRLARLLLASDGDIDHSVAVAQLLANKEEG
jgi:hypothetical protein